MEESIVEEFLPKERIADPESIDKFIFMESQLYGQKLSESAVDQIVRNINLVQHKQLPLVIQTLVHCKIGNEVIWNEIRKLILQNVEKDVACKSIATSLAYMGPYLAHETFCASVQPFVLKNLNLYDFETLLKLRNNFVSAKGQKGVVKPTQISEEYATFISSLEMRMVGILNTFGLKKCSLR